jgi:serine/threonine protein kinase
MQDLAHDIARRASLRPESERASFLDGVCGDDRDLRALVAIAMAAMQRPGSAAGSGPAARDEAPTADSAARPRATPVPPAPEGPGSSIGPYKILERIGEGGFGYVYMAQQSHPVKRKVAIKVIKPGMDSKQVLGRFEIERQALSMMDHPNIARVYDAGVTDTGRPYFVLELVRGVAITQYCDQQRLTTRERADLFITACHAVQHAHHKGVIHRDLKPGNILVTLHDGAPVVKVIDFGISKATNQDLSDRTVFTEFRQFIGTPEYMAPEQAAMSGLDVDTRADVYSLGVLLYELIAGAPPFDPAQLRAASLAEVQKIICDTDPPRPSTRLARTTAPGARHGPESQAAAQLAEEAARHRRTDARSLRNLLRGDLDCIVMKAMEKDRTRRYETASALADDLKRFLANEPILARPPSTLYRMRKFARRNRVGLGAAGIMLYALMMILAALAYALVEVRHERDMTAQRETVTRAQMILTTMNAVRDYTTHNVRPILAPDPAYTNFVKEMVPGFAARKVFGNFARADEYTKFKYKEASPNPTNRDNRADDFETALVARFEAEPETREVTGFRDLAGVPTFYIARPMAVKDKSCLDCHTTAETAPPKQIEQYGPGGMGWKLGEIVAAQMVYVPVSEAFDHERQMGVTGIAVVAGLSLVGVLGSLWLLLRRA